ncbi:hypothetical protein ACIPID_13575, partial [Cupriavidus sp. CER94]
NGFSSASRCRPIHKPKVYLPAVLWFEIRKIIKNARFHLGGPCCASVGMTFGLPAVAGAFDVPMLQIRAVSFACQVDEHLGGAGKGH